MESKDLMIGDWVLLGVEPIKVTYDLFLPGHLTDSYRPIPLTAEILEKNGFTQSRVGWIRKTYGAWDISVYLSQYAQIEIINYCGRGTDCQEVNYGSTIEFEHNISVHQLQHALRLCGLTELADNFQLPELPKEDTK